MKNYTTSEIAKIIKIHPNTVRLYEDIKFISPVPRQSNGYRIFNDLHIMQFKIARAALEVVLMQNGLRTKAIDIIKATANKDFDNALHLTNHYLDSLKQEVIQAENAIQIVETILSGETPKNHLELTRKEVSKMLNISMDTLRNWELNGLIKVKRKSNGYRVYTDEDIRYLKIISVLKQANYSLSAILRMLNNLLEESQIDIRKTINQPHDSEDIISACDQLLTSLNKAIENALFIQTTLNKMKEKFK